MQDPPEHPPEHPGLPIPPEYRESVLRQWRLNQELAAPLLAFDLPDDVQPAPVFHP